MRMMAIESVRKDLRNHLAAQHAHSAIQMEAQRVKVDYLKETSEANGMNVLRTGDL